MIVYFKVKITNNLNPVYYASEIKSDAKVLGKSKAVNLDLSNKLVVKDYDLFQNYPNPFNPATTISYQLPKSGSVTLKIYDMLGNSFTRKVNRVLRLNPNSKCRDGACPVFTKNLLFQPAMMEFQTKFTSVQYGTIRFKTASILFQT